MMKKKSGIIEEFKKFITRGNVMDMAVGVIVGGAFTTIVTSLNNDIISPILGIFGGVDFSDLKLVMGSGENAPVLKYGSFLTAVINFLIIAMINFLIIAMIIFLIVRAMNKINESIKAKLTDKEEVLVETTKVCPYCKEKVAKEATRCPHCTSILEEKVD